MMKLYCNSCGKDVTTKPVVNDLLCNLYCSLECLKKSGGLDFGIEIIMANIGLQMIKDFLGSLSKEDREKALKEMATNNPLRK